MSKVVKCGLIQATHACKTDESLETIREANIAKHIPIIEQAAKEGVQIICMQEIFTGPYFCAEQTTRWYDSTEKIPDGPTTKLMQEIAKKHSMVIVVPIYEEESPGVYYNTAAVIDADGTYLGKYRKNHIPHVAPGSGRSSTSGRATSATRSSRRATRRSACTSATTATSPRARARSGLNGAEIVFNPSATVAGLSRVSVEAGAAGARGRERLFRRRDQSRRHEAAVEHRRVLRAELLLRSARPVPGDRPAGQDELVDGRAGPRQDPRSPQHLAVLPRSATGNLRRAGRAVSQSHRMEIHVRV